MNMEMIRVKMLGAFSVSLGGTELSKQGGRPSKVWLMLAYLICCRERAVSQAELFRLLWGEEGSVDPQNALKTTLHRIRALLGPVGRELILSRDGKYIWNKDFPLELDAERFRQLCCDAAEESDPERRIDGYLQAVELYQGEFLPMFSTELWVVPMATYYHNLYIQTVLELVSLLREEGRREEAIRLCRQALKIEPYREELYGYLIRSLLDQGDKKSAIQAYEEMRELLQNNFGVEPPEDLRAMYREAVRTVNDYAISMENLREQLREGEADRGALVCEYDFFRVLYHAEVRAVARSGDAVHLALVSVQGRQELSKRSLDRVMENLRNVVRSNLRSGDIMAQCSPSQYIVMLPRANYENSGKVCQRLERAFFRQYPHSPVTLHFSIQPIEVGDY